MLQKTDGTPYSYRQLRFDNPQVSFPDTFPQAILDLFACRFIHHDPKPPYDVRTEKLVESAPTLIDGKWTISYSVVEMSNQEQLAYHRTRFLDAEQFEVFLILSGLDDAFRGLIDTFKAAGQTVALAKARRFMQQSEFNLGTVLDITNRFKTQIAQGPGSPDIKVVTLIGHWDAAEATDLG